MSDSNRTATPSSSQANEGGNMKELLKRIKKNLKTKNGEVVSVIDEDGMLALVEELETVQVTKEFLKSTGFGKIMRMIGGKTKYMSTSRKIKQLLKKYKYVVMDSINSKMQEYKEEYQEYHMKNEEKVEGAGAGGGERGGVVKGFNYYFNRMKNVEDEIVKREESNRGFFANFVRAEVDVKAVVERNEKYLKKAEVLESGKAILPYVIFGDEL